MHVGVTAETTPRSPRKPLVLVDGSNVAYGGGHLNVASLRLLRIVMEELDRASLDKVVFVDASLRHHIDDPAALESLIASGEAVQTPARRSADEFIVQLSHRLMQEGKEVYVLTNDGFADRVAEVPLPRIAFVIVPFGERQEVLFSPALESVSFTATPSAVAASHETPRDTSGGLASSKGEALGE